MQLDSSVRTIVLGFVGGVATFAAVLWLVGFGSVFDALADARPVRLAFLLLVAAAWLIAWGVSLRTVLAALDAPLGVSTAVFVYAAATFANNVTPFGQAGGEPLSALLLSRATDREYETGLAAIASVDMLHFVPSLGLGLIGLVSLATTVTFGRRLVLAAGTVVGLAVVLPAVGYVGWTNRYRLERTVVRLLTPVLRTGAGALPVLSPPDAAALERRIEGFFAAIERVATDRRQLLLSLGFSALGWIALATSLWLSLYAIGVTIPFLVTFVAIPVGDVAAVAPLPGGVGGVEALLIGVLLAATPVTAATASAAVVLHRVGTYWLPTVAGGGAAAIIVTE